MSSPRMKPPALKPNPEHLPFLNALRAKLGRPLHRVPPAPQPKAEPPVQLNLADYIRQQRNAKA